jgi:gluconolactonase
MACASVLFYLPLYFVCSAVDSSFDFSTSFPGKKLQTINFPNSKRTTSCCWGGKNLDELYVTCSAYQDPTKPDGADQFLAGSVFKVTGLGVKADKPAFIFEG